MIRDPIIYDFGEDHHSHVISRILQLRQSSTPHNWPNDVFYQFQAMLQSTRMHTDTDVICFDSREVWVTPFAGRKYDSLQAQAIICLPEIIAAFKMHFTQLIMPQEYVC